MSQYLIREVAYHDEPCTASDRLFQIVAFRTFSKPETWDGLRRILGHHPTIDDLCTDDFSSALERVKRENKRLYTGAFILCAHDAYGRGAKHLNHVELFRDMFVANELGERLQDAKSLESIYLLLHGFPLMGDFMSYQIAIDLNYSDVVCFSENDFTVPGPGALRGFKKVFENLGDYSPEDVIMWMVDRQELEFERFGFTFEGLWGRSLHAIDCQGLFCEVDKYCREAVPELKSERKRIKARFSVHDKPLRLFFPPKWGINDKLPNREVLGATAYLP